VKSAYHLAKELDTNMNSESSVRIAGNVVWRTLWKLPLTNTKKNLMWMVCHSLLPTKDNLLRRNVVSDPLCPICCIGAETIFHIFVRLSFCKRCVESKHTNAPEIFSRWTKIFASGGECFIETWKGYSHHFHMHSTENLV
jgi:hypothetical protein